MDQDPVLLHTDSDLLYINGRVVPAARERSNAAEVGWARWDKREVGKLTPGTAAWQKKFGRLLGCRDPHARLSDMDALGTDHVRQVRKDCAAVILYTAEKATWMAGESVQILGGNGYINEYPVGRLWRDAKLYEIGAGTSEIRRMLIGRELFAETM